MTDAALEIIARHAAEGARLREEFFRLQAEALRQAAMEAAAAIAGGGKLLFCGNGGSAADAQHLAAEFVNRFLMDRPALPAIALTTDTSALTAIGNDMGYEEVFSRQVEALGRPGDLLVGPSTSGNSPNVIRALEAAARAGVFTVGLSGHGGGRMRGLCRILLATPPAGTPLVQELHIAAGHLFCQLADHYLFENAAALTSHLEARRKAKD